MTRPPRTATITPIWTGQLQTDANGRPIPNALNVSVALRADAHWRGAFTFDAMRQEPWLSRQPPSVRGKPTPGPFPRAITPEDVTHCQIWMQDMDIRRVGKETVHDAIELVARHDHPFHPIRDELDALEWDGEPRIATWLATYIGVEDNEYHRQIGSMFLISMVARIYEPGCQCDYMLVLEGEQGEEKSKLCRALAGADYFSDALPDLGHGDEVRLSMHLRGKWLIEIPELSSFNRADSAQLKSFLTRRVEIFTPKYGRVERKEPRQCVFVGTTNDDAYLKDETGGRRFWPVKVRSIDIPAFLAARPQLLAEALDAYRQGRPYWPDKAFEKAVIAPEQGQRQFIDAWTDRIAEIIEVKTEISVAELGQLLGIANDRLDYNTQRRIAAILRTAQWERRRVPGKGNFRWFNPKTL